MLFKLTAGPFIDTVELETVALKVAVLPAVGKAAVQLLLLFQESLAPLPVQAPLVAKAMLDTKIQPRWNTKSGGTFTTRFIVREWNFCFYQAALIIADNF
jgi:hypothetical protein